MEDLITDPFRAARLVLRLRQEGVTDDGVLRAMETVDRGAFVDDPALKDLACGKGSGRSASCRARGNAGLSAQEASKGRRDHS